MYTEKQKQKIVEWGNKIAAFSVISEKDFLEYEYASGQLLEASKELDSLYDYDRWQNLQRLLGMEIPLKYARKFEALLWVNGIESIELKGVI